MFLNRESTYQPGVAFLNQIQKTHAAIAVLFGNRNNQTQVTTGKFTLGILKFLVVTLALADSFFEASRAFLTKQSFAPLR